MIPGTIFIPLANVYTKILGPNMIKIYQRTELVFIILNFIRSFEFVLESFVEYSLNSSRHS